jgi:hypothetical protein
VQLSQHGGHPIADLGANLADDLDGLAGGLGEVPFLVALHGVDRAGVAADYAERAMSTGSSSSGCACNEALTLDR